MSKKPFVAPTLSHESTLTLDGGCSQDCKAPV